MKAALRPSNAPWLVGVMVAALLSTPQNPANAASSALPPPHIVALLEEAAGAEGEEREIVRFWFSEADVLNVIVRIGGQPHEFKVSGAAEILWMGEPGAIAPPSPFVESVTGPTDFSALPLAARSRILTVVPDFVALSVEVVPARAPYYRLVGDSERGRVHISIKSTGALMSFDVDSDLDGLGDAFEISKGWNPELADTDGDGFPDYFEYVEPDGDPADANRSPKLVDVRFDGEALVATLSTFEGAAFYLEYPDPESEGWLRMGEAILGDGGDHDFAIPVGGGAPLAGLLRAGITDPEEGVDTGDAEEVAGSGEECSVPASLVGRELLVGGGRRLCFKSPTRGEELFGEGGALLVTPFAYSFRRAGQCKARVTLNFNTAAGIETTVFTLTFGANGSATGAFASARFAAGFREGNTEGVFTLN